jgi:2-phosphosulfolactate phosphatase
LSRDLWLVPVAQQATEALVVNRCVVVIDVFRATTTVLAALEAGAREVCTASEVDTARLMKERLSNAVLAGERGGFALEGFDLGNSPLEMTPASVEGRTMILTTTNGTLAVERSGRASCVYAACVRNAEAVARVVESTELNVTIVCAGTEGRYSVEDVYAGGLVAAHLSRVGYDLDDGAAAAAILSRTDTNTVVNANTCRHYRNLIERGLGGDIPYCLQKNSSQEVPILSVGKHPRCFRLKSHSTQSLLLT